MASHRITTRIGRKCIPLATLKVHGPDAPGIVAASTDLLNRHGCTIVQSEHYTDRSHGWFFNRILFEDTNRIAACSRFVDFHNKSNESFPYQVETQSAEMELNWGLKSIGDKFGVKCELDWARTPKRVAIMVSKYDHCLWELLLRYQAQELRSCEIPLVISNHKDCQSIAEDTFRIPFAHFPMTADTKEEQEKQQLALLKEYNIDVIVLARYMQVLSRNFLDKYPDRIINIHHSFLPAFSGGRAYHQAFERGVKLIGATAHYATVDLDQGPIIEQDVIQVSHRDEPKDYMAKGRLLERSVLVRALQAHIDNRIIVCNNKCVVFGD